MSSDVNNGLSSGSVFQERYEIISVLGSGGFADVYRARQLTTKQEVALKVIHSISNDKKAHDREVRIDRFQREVQLCAMLHHPNIVPLLDSGQSEEGLLYAVFSIVPGHDLGDLLEMEGHLGLPETVHIMGQVLDALAAAHAQGIVHRDLKPANIMVNSTGGRRNATVLDFGIGAFTHDEQQLKLQRLTDTGTIVGTPCYVPPEQIRGRAPTARSDLYSWGLVFLECLTGQPAMAANSVHQVLYRQIDPKPVELPPMLQFHPLGPLLMTVLEKDVDLRNVTATDVLQELERYGGITQESPTADKTPVPEQASMVGFDCTMPALEETPVELSLEAEPPQPTMEAGLPNQQPTSSLRRPENAGEHRQVSAVSCYFSVLADEDSDEGLEGYSAVTRQLMQICKEVTSHHKGQVSRLTSEEALLLFGVPSAREDDARRAVRAALQIMDEVGNQAVRASRRGVNMEIQVAVNTGLVVYRSPSDEEEQQSTQEVVGPAITTAVQLAALAEPFTVLVTSRTQQLLKNQFRFEAEGTRRLRGQAQPVEYFRVAGLGKVADRCATITTGERARMVGREHELGMLKEIWRNACGGMGHGVLISGEPGIGKSRLALEVMREVKDNDGLYLECQCAEEDRSNPWRPIVDLLESLLGYSEEHTNEAKVARLEQYLREAGMDLDKLVPTTGALLSLSLDAKYPPPIITPEQRKHLTIDAVLSLILELTVSHPLLLVVEDLQWADPTTLDVLGQLLEEVSTARLCLVLTARPEFVPSWPSTEMSHFRLGRLAPGQVAELMLGIAQDKTLPQALIDTVVERADGISLFVEELTRELLNSDVVEEQDRCYVLHGSVSDISIPDTLWGLLSSQLDRLDRAKGTAQLAATIGREFSFELLCSVSPLKETDLQRDLSAMVSAGLVRRMRQRSDMHYAFRHALVRDTAYRSMLTSQRRKAHAAVASAIEQDFPQLAQRRPDLLAHYHAEANNKTEALGYARKAALEALLRSAHQEALRLAKHAMQWLDAVKDQRARVEIELDLYSVISPASMVLEGYSAPAFSEAAQRSVELVEVLGDSPHMSEILFALAIHQHHRLDFRAQARDLGELLVQRAEASEDSGQHGTALTLLAQCRWTEGNFNQARELLERAIEIYQPGGHEPYSILCGVDFWVWAKMTLAHVLLIQGQPHAARESANEALQHARKINQSHSEALALLSKAQLLQMEGDREGTRETARELEELAGKHGMPHIKTWAVLLGTWAEQNIGKARMAVEVLHAGGMARGATQIMAIFAQTLAAKGEHQEALDKVQEALGLAQQSGEQFHASFLRRLAGQCLMQLGRTEEGEQALSTLATDCQSAGLTYPALQAALSLHTLLPEGLRHPAARIQLKQLCDELADAPQPFPLLDQARTIIGV